MRRRRLVAAVGAALAALPLIAGHAVAAPVLAVQDDRLLVEPLVRLPERADLIAATGARWTRVDVLWSDVAPSRPRHPADPDDPAYRWERLDAILAALADRGVRALLCAYSTPGWAAGGRRDHRWVPNRFDYAAFMVALGRRYSGRHRVAGRRLPRVTHFELWNEPNMRMYLRPQWRRARGRWVPASPRLYARILRVTTPRLRRARPDALVIAGALGPTSTSKPNVSVGIRDFVRGLAVLRPPVMAASQHIYPGAPPGRSRALPSAFGIPRIRRLWGLVRPRIPLYITETGYTTARTPYRRYRVSRAQQAAYLPRLLRALDLPGVRMVVWYNLQGHRLWPGGLIDQEGRRKPSWRAFRRYLATERDGR